MLQPNEVIDGKYRIVRLLGQGGMGAVYEGENTRIHRKVAIKVLHAAVAAKADVVQRFEREAQAAGRIGSDHIVEVLDLGNLPTGERFMVMEFLEGESLGDRIKRFKRLPVHEVAPIVYQLLEGLAAAHQAGIIHRDLKPDNVYLLTSRSGQRDFVKVLDFGVSKFSALDQDSLSMTKTGAVMGTPYYMSPEQARGSKIDARSDLYSVGVVMYQAVTGRVPFAAETFNELVFKIALESPEPAELVVPGLEPAFASIVAKAMIRDVNLRFQAAREFQAAIAQWMSTGGAALPHAQPSHPWAMSPGGTVSLPGGHADASGQHNQMFATSPVPGMHPHMGGSHPNMSGSGPYGVSPHMSQSGQQLGGGPLGASQVGLSMTARQPRGNGAMIAIGLIGTLMVAGGAFGVYKLVAGGGGAQASPPPATASATTSPDAPPTVPPPATAPPETTTAATTEPSPSATTAPTGAPAADTGQRPVTGKVLVGTGKKPPTTPSAAPTAAPKTTGRTIGSEL